MRGSCTTVNPCSSPQASIADASRAALPGLKRQPAWPARRPWITGPCRRRQSRQRLQVAASADPYAGIEKAVQLINGIIGAGSRQGEGESRSKNQRQHKPKWVSCTSNATVAADVDGSRQLGKTLQDYLALPVEQYSLLDPQWVQRDAGDPSAFRVVVPLQSTTGVQAQPQVLIRVCVDPESQQVTFTSEYISLGEPALDAIVQLDLRASLGCLERGDRKGFQRFQRAKAPAWPPVRTTPQQQPAAAAPAATSSSAGADAQDSNDQAARSTDAIRVDAAPSAEASNGASHSTMDPYGDLGSTPELAGYTRGGNDDSSAASVATSARGDVFHDAARLQLASRTDLRVSIYVPPPYTRVPSRLLSLTGGLVLKAALKALLPRFVDLLAQDYAGWAAGDSRGVVAKDPSATTGRRPRSQSTTVRAASTLQ